jgi:large subunit ribosomal protein L14e
MLNEIGRLCVKIAGRDSNKTCVIVDVIDEHTVLIDGQTRRRNCNVKHLEPLNKVIKLSKGASHAHVKTAFEEINLEVLDTKPKKATERSKKSKAEKVQEVKETKPKKEKKAKAEKGAKTDSKSDSKSEKSDEKKEKKVSKKVKLAEDTLVVEE